MIANAPSRHAFLNNKGNRGGGKSWRPRKFGNSHVGPLDQDQDDYYGNEEADEEVGDEQNGQDDHEDECEEDEGVGQDPDAALEHDDEQHDEDDLHELFGAFVQFMRAGKKMR